MLNTHLISAICTPLRADQSLDADGLAAHVHAQLDAGIGGLLVAGTMGLMQLQADDTYRRLVQRSVEFAAGRVEVMVGVGDASFARTRQRIEWVHELDIDGVVVITPYLFHFTQRELVNYFHALGNVSCKPVYLYVLPSLTRAVVEIETVLRVAEHPNVRGIKCSTPWDWTQQLMERAPADFRIIPAQPTQVDSMIRQGVKENLDGIFAVFQRLTVGLAQAAERGDCSDAAARQQIINGALDLLRTKYPLFPAVSAILNALGITGSIAPQPFAPLADADRRRLLSEPVIEAALALEQAAPAARP